eukprot:1026318-Rhodomonas_salina.1
MGLIKGVKGSNADRMIIQRYYGDKDVVANSMLREVSKREPALLDKVCARACESVRRVSEVWVNESEVCRRVYEA